MKKNTLLLGLALIIFACQRDHDDFRFPDTHSNQVKYLENLKMPDIEIFANNLMQEAGWNAEQPISSQFERRKSPSSTWLESNARSIIDEENNIAHYIFKIRVGPGKYDMINLHRVVKERSRNFPKQSKNTLFLQHGDFKDFEGMFLPGVKSPRLDDSEGIANFLAKNDVDVWGIDQAWTLIPEEETDFTFMKDWGMQRQVQDLKKAMTLVRVIRFLSGNGLTPLNLLGYSSGSTVGFALLNEETSITENNHNVAGYIGVDQGVHTDNSIWENITCDLSAGYQALLDAGQYQDYNPLPFFGSAAQSDPEGASELIPGFSNLQAAQALAIYPLFEPYPGHFLAGIFDSNSLPTGLQNVSTEDWLDFLIYSPPYEPVAFERDEYMTSCPSAVDVSWDDNLSQVQNPILYIVAGGGFGSTGTETLNQLGSADITTLEISLYPKADVALDFGHIDLFLANNADEQVWKPILSWILAH
ncbi:MAG: hypothetical protein KDC53_23990 [Saprospiraceae bacterium]|nr:hypothetical protein [Saprospiraceae bacterium]